ncbi:MAG: alpha-galactosidase [Culicoidibacterales bacterium]
MGTTIYFEQASQQFHLQGETFSYIIQVLANGQLGHLYYGAKLRHQADFSHQFYTGGYGNTCTVFPTDETFCLDLIAQEYPTYGTSDYRQPAIEVLQADGSRIVDFKYESHDIRTGKAPLQGLPSTFASAEQAVTSLAITLRDQVTNLVLTLTYTVFAQADVLTRHAHLDNQGTDSVQIGRFLSMNLDLADKDYELMTFTGAWVRERHLQVQPLHHGLQSVSSTRGTSSSTANPFFVLKRPTTTEASGEAYAFNLVYSGNHVGQVEVTPFDTARVQQGLNYFDFNWDLQPQTQLQAPEVVMVYSNNGLNGMSHRYHNFYRNHLINPNWVKKQRPVLINNWEATYFDFNEAKILELAKAAKQVGVELFVLDDGWFGQRNDDQTSLGDWFHNPQKLPNGVKGLADQITDLGLEFGLWIEPEMVSPNSELYRQHPEWVIQVPNRPQTLGRNQCVLDFTNPSVVEHVYEMIAKVIREGGDITYIKWDWNRTMTEIGSLNLPAQQQQEVAHRYILGMYTFYEQLVTQFPHILVEGCAAGGSRFDPAILAYSPQIWTSDDSDAVERLKIQYSTSFAYPLSTMGAHVSAVPNHQVHRVTSLKTRGDVAFFGVLGYELDLTQLPESELAAIADQIAFYKQHRELVISGDFYRLLSPYEGNETAWALVSRDQSECLVGYYTVLAQPNVLPARIKLQGLDACATYALSGTTQTFGGDELMNWGIELNPRLFNALAILEQVQGDYASVVLAFTKVTPTR